MKKPGEIKAISRTSAFLLPACLFLLCLLVSSGCIEKIELPSEIDTDGMEFSAGDTTYLLLSPVWDESYGFQSPIEISIAKDGHIFVADSAANSIFVLKQDGDIAPGFDDLDSIALGDEEITPIDVDIDQKMNVFFIDGTDTVYIWNQYWNNVGIDSFVTRGIFLPIESGDSVMVEAGTNDWINKVNSSEWNLIQTEWDEDSSLVNSLLKPHIFFIGGNQLNLYNFYISDYYSSEESKFSGISAPGDNSDFIYATDAFNNRIIRIDFYKTYYLKLSTGEEVWVHEGYYKKTITRDGTGAGYVNQPLSIDVDYDGSVYYSQSGGNYNAHKIKLHIDGNWKNEEEWEGNTIMDLPSRFLHPEDIAVDQNQMVYVANTDAQEIQVFNSDGSFFKKAGVDYISVDTSYIGLTLKDTSWTEFLLFFDVEDVNGNIIYTAEDTTITHFETLIDTTIIDTSYTKEIKMLEQPRAVTVDSRGVIYICDTPTSSILRFRLSNQLDENLNPVP